jgi:hypothetical protein
MRFFFLSPPIQWQLSLLMQSTTKRTEMCVFVRVKGKIP